MDINGRGGGEDGYYNVGRGDTLHTGDGYGDSKSGNGWGDGHGCGYGCSHSGDSSVIDRYSNGGKGWDNPSDW